MQSSTLANPPPPSLLIIHVSHICKELCIVVNFLVLWFICLSSYLGHFKNGPEFLIWWTAQVSIPLMRFFSGVLGFKQFIIIICIIHIEFFTPMTNRRSPQLSRTLLSILADLNNAVFWMVSTRPLISKSSSPCTNPLVIVPTTPIKIGFTVIFMFHGVFRFLSRSRFLSLFLLSFGFTLRSVGRAKSTILQVPFFCWLLLGLVVWPSLGDLFVSQNPREFCVSHFLGHIMGYAYTICSYGQI